MDTPTKTLPKIDPREKKRYYFTDTPQRRALIGIARSIFKLILTTDVRGLENFPHEGPAILAANHVTNFDVFPMQFALPRPIFFMGKAELFKNPLVDLLLRNLSGFPIHRGEKDDWAMRHAAKVLKHGQTLGMFPEGKRSKGKGLAVAKTGAARLAIEGNCAIVPMAVVGSDQFFKRLPDVRANHDILTAPTQAGESTLALTDRLMFTLAQALPEEMRGAYAELPKAFTM